jgi:hypothetical protein
MNPSRLEIAGEGQVVPDGYQRDLEPVRAGLIHDSSMVAKSTMDFAHWLRSRGRFGVLGISAASIFSEPSGRFVNNPRSCFGLRLELIDMDFFAMWERDPHIPPRLCL